MSYTYILEAGMRINWNGQSYLIRAFEPDFAVLENSKGQKCTFEPKVIFEDYAAGKLKLELKSAPVVYQPLTSQVHIEQAELMNSYLNALDNELNPRSRKVIKKVINKVAKDNNYSAEQVPSDSKLYRWYNSWIENNRSVIPLIVKAKKKRKSQIDQRVFALADQVIWDEYMQLNGVSRAQVLRIYQKRHRETYPDLREISQSRFYELFDELNPVEVTIAREGRDAARKFKRTNLNVFVAEYMGERYETDAVHFNIGIYDATTGNYIGTPIVYISIDVFTRYVTGYSISYSPATGKKKKNSESAADVIALLKNMATPKAHGEHLKNTWEYLGLPSYIVCDAGPAFRAKPVISLLAAMKCEHHTTETASPWKKPFVERFNRTLRDHFAKKLPGYMGRRVEDKQFDETLVKMAKLTADEFKESLEKFIVDVYHQNSHRGLDGLSPAQAVSHAQKRTFPALVPNMNTLDVLGGVEFKGTIQTYSGIQKNSLHYQSTELRSLYNRLSTYETKGNPKVTYLYDINDISKIAVIDPDTMEAFSVPCTHPHIECGLSLYEYKANKQAVLEGTYQVLERSTFAAKRNTDSTSANSEHHSSSAKKGTPKGHTISISGHQSDEEMAALIDSQQSRIAKDFSDSSIKESASEKPSKQKTKRKRSKTTQGK